MEQVNVVKKYICYTNDEDHKYGVNIEKTCDNIEEVIECLRSLWYEFDDDEEKQLHLGKTYFHKVDSSYYGFIERDCVIIDGKVNILINVNDWYKLGRDTWDQ